MRGRSAIAQYEATMVLVVISLALASVVYTGLRRESGLDPQPLFVNRETAIGGSPAIERIELNSSSATTISSLRLDSASSSSGVLDFDGTSYSTVKSLCAAGVTTFFSVFAPRPGPVKVAADGVSWVSGTWGGTANVSSGWQEVMIAGATSCAVTLPGGEVVSSHWNASSSVVSSVPVEGSVNGTSFVVYVPSGGGTHRLLVTATGGFDLVSV